MELLTIQKLYLFVHYCGIVSETCIVLECKRKLKLAMNQILDESSTAINHGVHQEREKKNFHSCKHLARQPDLTSTHLINRRRAPIENKSLGFCWQINAQLSSICGLVWNHAHRELEVKSIPQWQVKKRTWCLMWTGSSHLTLPLDLQDKEAWRRNPTPPRTNRLLAFWIWIFTTSIT